MKVDVKKEYEVGLRGTSYSKVVEAQSVAEAKAMTMKVLKTRYPSKTINPDRDLIARLFSCNLSLAFFKEISSSTDILFPSRINFS